MGGSPAPKTMGDIVMVYRNNFIAVVKCNNKILREQYNKDQNENVVAIPFNSEYTILLKNKNSRRAFVSIEIDGECITNCGDIVVEPNSSLELERFLDDMYSGNKFKFLKKTKEIAEYRGDRVDDGIIRIEYWYEKEKPVFKYYYPQDFYYNQPKINPWEKIGSGLNPPDNSKWYSTKYGSTSSGSDCLRSFNTSDTTTYYSSTINCCSSLTNNSGFNDSEGVTGKGEVSNQEFSYIYGLEKEDKSEVICIKLCGITKDNKYITKPINVKTKIKCDMCGKTHKSNKQFCDRCGNFIKI